MKNKRQLAFRLAALLIVLAVAAAMFVIGRGHTVYFDNRSAEYDGQAIEAFYKVNVLVGGEKAAGLSARDRGMKEIMGQTLTMTLEITDEKGTQPHSHRVTLPIPYNMDGVIVNLPALMAGLPEEAYMEEFVIVAPAEDTEEAQPGTDDLNPENMDTDEPELGDI